MIMKRFKVSIKDKIGVIIDMDIIKMIWVIHG